MSDMPDWTCPKCGGAMERKDWPPRHGRHGKGSRDTSFYDTGAERWLSIYQCVACKNVEVAGGE